MIFQTDELTLKKDLQAFLSLTAERQARFDAAPDDPPAAGCGVNDQQKRLHPELQTLRLYNKTHTANGLLSVTLKTDGGPAAVFRPGQQARVYCEGVSYPLFFASAPADAAKGVYTLGADPEAQPAAFRYLDSLNEGDAVSLRAPIGSFYYLGIRDRGPLRFLCDKSGLPAAAAFAAALPQTDAQNCVFCCVGCETEPFFDERFLTVGSLASLPAFSKDAAVFVCGTDAFCRAARALPAFSGARSCRTEQPKREVPLQTSFRCTLVTADGERTFPCSADLPLLAALEAAGIRVPANCAGGECGFCRCRLLEGEVTLCDPPEADPRRTADAARSVLHACRVFPDSDLTIAF